jgi:hypothetical protein
MSSSVSSAVVELCEMFVLLSRKLMCSQGVSLCCLIMPVPVLSPLSTACVLCTGMWWTITHMGWTYHHMTFMCLTPIKKTQRNDTFGFARYSGVIIPKAADRDFCGEDPSAGVSIDGLPLRPW